MPSRKDTLLIEWLMFVIVGATSAASCAPATSVSTLQTNSESTTTKAQPLDRISISADDLAKAFKDNEAAANERFLNHVVEISGTVQSVGATYDPGGYIYLGGIKWETEDKEPWAKVLPGQSVVVEGKFKPGVKMKIMKVSGHRLAVAAEQLAREFQADRDTANAKYKDKWLEVHGKVTKVEQNAGEFPSVFLEGNNNMLIQCRCQSETENFAKKLQPGDQVRLVGRFLVAGDDIDIGACLAISK
jgi:hypothetical protein